MQLMLCIEGSDRTNTVAGQVYEAVGFFTCPHCGHVSDILEFAPPVTEFHSINCWHCKEVVYRKARYSHKKRFIPLNDLDATMDDVVVERETSLA